MAIISFNQECSPSVLDVLSGFSESNLHHFEYELRHPVGIYRNSMNEIARRFGVVYAKLEQLNSEYESGKSTNGFGELLDAHETLLYRIREFIDDCYLVLQGIAPLDSRYYPKTIFANQYLTKIKFPGFKSFERKIEFYRNNHVGAIVNALKHKQRTLRGIYFYSQNDGKLFVPGYYVEGVSKKGSLAPCRSVHPDENSAFSFNRDLKLHVWNILQIDTALSDVIESAMDVWNIRASRITNEPQGISLSNLLVKAAALPNQYFFDEQAKPTVRFQHSESLCELEYPCKKGIEQLPSDVSIRSMHVVDMTVPHMVLPYYRR